MILYTTKILFYVIDSALKIAEKNGASISNSAFQTSFITVHSQFFDVQNPTKT